MSAPALKVLALGAGANRGGQPLLFGGPGGSDSSGRRTGTSVIGPPASDISLATLMKSRRAASIRSLTVLQAPSSVTSPRMNWLLYLQKISSMRAAALTIGGVPTSQMVPRAMFQAVQSTVPPSFQARRIAIWTRVDSATTAAHASICRSRVLCCFCERLASTAPATTPESVTSTLPALDTTICQSIKTCPLVNRSVRRNCASQLGLCPAVEDTSPPLLTWRVR